MQFLSANLVAYQSQVVRFEGMVQVGEGCSNATCSPVSSNVLGHLIHGNQSAYTPEGRTEAQKFRASVSHIRQPASSFARGETTRSPIAEAQGNAPAYEDGINP